MKSSDHSATSRRAFLGAVTAAPMTLVAASESVKADPAPVKPSGSWDLSWVERVAAAKHRMVFDAAEVDFGVALFNAQFWLRDFHDVYAMPDAEAAAVIVARHNAVPMVLGDDAWSLLNLGAETNMREYGTGEGLSRNPFVHMRPDPNSGVDALIKRGVIVLACNQALGNYVGKMAAAKKTTEEEARATLLAGLVPGTIVMPSGIFAVARAQEAGCLYMRST